MIDFTSIEQMLRDTEQAGLPLWKHIQLSDCHAQDITPESSWARMSAMLESMIQADEGYRAEDRSHSGLVGGDGGKMAGYGQGGTLCGPLLTDVIAGALRMGECNACMKRIVAAPTAGACGVLPAVLLPLQRKDRLSDEDMVKCLYVSAGFGQVIATRASISGAEGGCQAEVGSASAMAAAALIHARGGPGARMAAACAMALQNVMGLVCDPVAGLVECPCVKRNVMGAVNALTCADMALAGLSSPIPCDEVIDAMGAVGRSLPSALRETGQGGLAATPSGRRIAQGR